MIIKYLKNFTAIVSFCCLINLTNTQEATAQVTGDHVVKWISVGSLRHWFSNGGAEIEYGRRGRAGFEGSDQSDGLVYPSEYTRNKGVNVAKALWIGTTNFADPVSGKTFPYKVVTSGPRATDLLNEIFPIEFYMIGKFDHPAVFVDGNSSSYRDSDDELDEIDETIQPDRTIITRFHTSIGVTVTRKIHAFSQQNHDNYYIYEYTFKNTGIIDASGEKKLDKKLTDVVFSLINRLGFAGEAYAGGWSPSGSAWGRNTINDAMGDPNHPGEFRAVWSYYGPVSGSPGVAEDIGLPRHANGSIMAGTNFCGSVVLHADKSSSDKNDDPAQPSSTLYLPTDLSVNGIGQYDENNMGRKYNEFMTPGHPAKTQAEEIGKDANGWPTAFANTWGSDAGGYASSQSFGPYNLEIGDSIHIVLAEVVAGISRDKNREVVNKWFNQITPYDLPNGTTTTDRNVYKNSWVFSGKDSLFESFRRAKANYNNNFVIPQPPPPPEQVQVNSGGNKIILSWAKNAESFPNFDGYRVYRAEGRTDTTFDKIFESSLSKGNLTNTFEDKTAKRGFNYYYYIQSMDNGSTNDAHPGVPLVSSKYYTMTYNAAYLTRPAGEGLYNSTHASFNGDGVISDFTLPMNIDETVGITVKVDGIFQIRNVTYSIQDTATLHFTTAPSGSIEVELTKATGGRNYSLSAIKIVPNPFYIKARDVQFGVNPNQVDRLAFYGLPPECKIRIYTETGDLIETIDHIDGSGDELWHSLTSSKQLVVSGLYIAHFEVTEDAYDEGGQLIYRKGDSTYKKFIIIR